MRFCERREAAGHTGTKGLTMGSVARLRDVPQRHTPVRRPNHELRTREHLTEREVEKLIDEPNRSRPRASPACCSAPGRPPG
jgi:hypothetical protein